jgi:hypothetical protein
MPTQLCSIYMQDIKREKNFISKLVDEDGLVLTNNEDKEQNVFKFYSHLLGESTDRDIIVNLEELNIPPHDLAELEAPFS